MGPEPSRTKLHPICPYLSPFSPPGYGAEPISCAFETNGADPLRSSKVLDLLRIRAFFVVFKLLRCQKTWQFQMSKTETPAETP